jgi:Flp pilus assembly protein TadD
VRELDDPHGVLPVENGRAMLLVARGRLDEAEAAYRRSLEGQGSPSLRGSVLVNLAECLLLKGSLREAEAAGRELERTAVVHRLAPLLPYVYRGLGAIARARGDDEGFVFYEQVLDLCRDGGYPPIELAVTQHDYALLEADHGRLESAAARLGEALDTYRRLGTRPETERAEADLAAVRARMGIEASDDAMALTTHTDGRT